MRFSYALLVAVLLFTGYQASASSSIGASSDLLTESDDSYVLGVGDKLRITVYGEADLTGEFVVDSAGSVQFPLVGQVTANHLSTRAFSQLLTTKLGEYLKSPRVSIEVETYRPFYIIGEVNKPGEYPYVNGMSVINAVALAGGYTYRANDSKVYVRRSGSEVEEEDRSDTTTKIHPGDIVRVPERLF